MTPSQQRYRHELLWVTIGHGLTIGMVFAFTAFEGCNLSMPDISKPMELIVEPPPNDAPIPVDLAHDTPPQEKAEPQHEEKAEEKPEHPPDRDEVVLPDKTREKPKPKPPVKPKETKKPEPKDSGKIKISKVLVRRPLPGGKGKLTPDEVRRLLDRGAKLGPKSNLSEADMRRLLNGDSRFGDGSPVSQEFVVLDMVRQAMYRAWNQPTDIGIAGLVTKVELTFSSDGAILSSRMISSSGNKTMDGSVMRAVQSVRRVPGLPASFLSSHRRIPVSFELTGN